MSFCRIGLRGWAGEFEMVSNRASVLLDVSFLCIIAVECLYWYTVKIACG